MEGLLVAQKLKIDQDLKAIESVDPINGMIANLRRDIPSFDVTPEMAEGKYQRHSFLPLIFTISRQKNAKDWFTGTILSSTNVGPEHQLELHHHLSASHTERKGRLQNR